MLAFLCITLIVPIVSSQTSDTVSFQSSGIISYESYPPPVGPPPADPPPSDPPPDDPPPTTGNPALQVVGTHLEDGDGNVVYLQGAQVDWNERRKVQGGTSRASSPDESWFTEADVQAMKAAGANYFEVHRMALGELMPTRGNLGTTLLSNWIDEYVAWASDNGMYVVLNVANPSYPARWMIPDWFWEDAGYDEPTNEAEWEAVVRDFFDTDVAAMDITRAAIETLWEGLANRYKTNPYVLFSPFNEPFMGFDMVDQTTENHLAETYSEFMEDIVDAIHSTGATNIIIIDRPYVLTYSPYYNSIQPVDREGIIWEDHYYMTPTHDWDNWCGWIDDYFDRIVGVFGKPLLIGEYGFDPQEHGKDAYPSTWLTHLANQASYIDAKDGACGRQWHMWGTLEGEYYDYVYDYYTAQDSESILAIAMG
jgi:hypothetical protein